MSNALFWTTVWLVLLLYLLASLGGTDELDELYGRGVENETSSEVSHGECEEENGSDPKGI